MRKGARIRQGLDHFGGLSVVLLVLFSFIPITVFFCRLALFMPKLCKQIIALAKDTKIIDQVDHIRRIRSIFLLMRFCNLFDPLTMGKLNSGQLMFCTTEFFRIDEISKSI